mmetsp:Transcript_61730/g.198966  ORF Transcript_61730/g.198966 Transcript_61730/m.198966 type:complete len:285 (+) Transcript_61730:214-1068(+)
MPARARTCCVGLQSRGPRPSCSEIRRSTSTLRSFERHRAASRASPLVTKRRSSSPRSGTASTRPASCARRANCHCWTLASGLTQGTFPRSTASARLWSPVVKTRSSHCSKKLLISARGILVLQTQSLRPAGRGTSLREPLHSRSRRVTSATTQPPALASRHCVRRLGATTMSTALWAAPPASRVKLSSKRMPQRNCESCPALPAADSAQVTSVFGLKPGSLAAWNSCSASFSPLVFSCAKAMLPSGRMGITLATARLGTGSLPLPSTSGPRVRKLCFFSSSFRL